MMNQQKTESNQNSQVIWVTPAMAESWLETKANFQRYISSEIVAKYTKIMNQGLWKVTPTHSIGITCDNIVVDGQHRLSAVIRHNAPVKMSVAFGVDPDTFNVIDRGRIRTLVQIAQMGGSGANSYQIAALNSLHWRLEAVSSLKKKWDAGELCAVAEHFKDQLSVVFPDGYTGSGQFRSSAYRGAALRAVLAMPDRAKDITDFVKVLATNSILDESLQYPGDAQRYTMAQGLHTIAAKHISKNGAKTTFEMWAITLKALNHYLSGRKLKSSSSLGVKLTNQPFPILLDEKPDYQSFDGWLKPVMVKTKHKAAA